MAPSACRSWWPIPARACRRCSMATRRAPGRSSRSGRRWPEGRARGCGVPTACVWGRVYPGRRWWGRLHVPGSAPLAGMKPAPQEMARLRARGCGRLTPCGAGFIPADGGGAACPSRRRPVYCAPAIEETRVTIAIHWIRDDDQLARQCDVWRAQPFVVLDTEFMRVDTFYPIAGLVQVGDAHRTTLIDPLCINDWSPFAALLDDAAVVKALHACSEDLEVFQRLTGTLPQPLFDT